MFVSPAAPTPNSGSKVRVVPVLGVAGACLFQLVGITLELDGLEHAEQAVVRGPRPLGEIVKLSRFCAKVFRLTHKRARPLLDYAPLKIFNSRAFAAFQFGAYPRGAVTFRVKVATGAIDAGQPRSPGPDHNSRRFSPRRI